MAETAVTLHERDGTLTRVLPAERPPGQPGRLIVTALTPAGSWPCTVQDTEERKALLLHALRRPDVNLDRGGGEVPVELTHALAVWRGVEETATKEISYFSWLVLVDGAGRTFGSSSHTLPHQVAKLYDSHPHLHTGGSVWVRLSWRNSKRGRGPHHTLQVLTRAQVEESGDAAE